MSLLPARRRWSPGLVGLGSISPACWRGPAPRSRSRRAASTGWRRWPARSRRRAARRCRSRSTCATRLRQGLLRRGRDRRSGRSRSSINNAGITDPAFITRMTEKQWRDVLDVNLDGVFRVGQEAARRMVAGGKGGVDRQYRLDRRPRRHQDARRLRGLEGGRARTDAHHGAGAGARQGPRQCAGARLYLDRAQRQLLGDRGGQAHDRARADAPARAARASWTGRCCCWPRGPARS